jgi:3-deoxy-D-manno-octulosonic-acid transferase
MPALTAAWSAAASLAAPALRVMLARRAARGKEITSRLAERFGIDPAPRPAGKLLWLHAASVGETVSALPLLAHLPPGMATLFTTGTVTSARLLADRLPELCRRGPVLHRFVPLDVPAWAARFLDHWRPDAACFLESELWPNLLAACARRGIPVALVNARLSARSARLWARAPHSAREVLRAFSWIAAQSEADAQRFRALGAVSVIAEGNLKWAAPALPADPADLQILSDILAGRPRWLAASTHPEDDAIVATVHHALAPRHPGLLTAIVPRHPERGAAVAARLAAPRRSLGHWPAPAGSSAGGFWVADTLGELGLLYRAFPIVFMGKSFAGGGGQNPWEPARLGCAVATGPDTQNFTESVVRLERAGALRIVPDAAALTEWVDRMLTDDAARCAMGEAGRRVAGTSDRLAVSLVERLAELIGSRQLAEA